MPPELPPEVLNSVTAIYVVGPSSTGKTTLCAALAKVLGLSEEAYVTEVARSVMRQTRFSRADVGKLAMQQAIADAHVAADAAARAAALRAASKSKDPAAIAAAAPRGAVILCDRSALDALVYARLAGVGAPLARSRALQTALGTYRGARATFVLLRPVAAFALDDGVRSLEDGQRCFAAFEEVLREYGIRYFELGESCRLLEERVAFVRRCAWI